MEHLKTYFSTIAVLLLLITSACDDRAPVQLDKTTTPTNIDRHTRATDSTVQSPTEPAVLQTPQETVSESDQAVLLFGIGLHIEPFGAVPSSLVDGATQIPSRKPASGNGHPLDYNRIPFFKRSVQDIRLLTHIVEQHDGVLTIQVQTPFTQVALSTQDTILSDLAMSGHEMALHFHEDAHLGKNSESLPMETWCDVMKEEIGLIQQASGVSDIRFWSGGNLYTDLFEAAACAGLDVNSDWKNPNTQSTPLELVGLHPWRPAGGTDGYNLTQITRHDPRGSIIFLPEGLYDRSDFASMRRSQSAGGDQAYFEFLKESLLNSLTAAEPGNVNVFHFTVHPGEFRGDPQNPFQVIERFLKEVIDPLVASGQLRWVTFSEMADAFQAWELANPDTDPR